MRKHFARVLLVLVGTLFGSASLLRAELAPGDVIDAASVEKVRGMVPDFIVEWVKSGKTTLEVGALAYDHTKFQPANVLKSLEGNKEKYEGGKDSAIIEVATGKEYPRDILGVPFPEITKDDPNAGMKLIYNFRYREMSLGNWEKNGIVYNYGASGKRDAKEYTIRFFQGVFDPAKSRHDWAWIKYFMAPYDWAGSPLLQMLSIDPSRPMMAYFYIAPTRKTLRITADSNTSEISTTQEATSDDTWGGGPSYVIQKGSYRLVEERQALVPFVGVDPYKLKEDEKGRLVHVVSKDEALLVGDETEGWTGAPWLFSNLVWIKTKVYLVEVEGHLDNYNFGTAKTWVDTETFSHYFKEAPDRKGEPFHGNMFVHAGYEAPDGTGFVTYRAGHICENLQNGRKSVHLIGTKEGQDYLSYVGERDMSIFTRSGYKRFGK